MTNTINITQFCAGSGIPGVVSVWNKEFGIGPEYSQKISPEQTTTILKFAQPLKVQNIKTDPINDLINDPINGTFLGNLSSKLPSNFEMTSRKNVNE